MSIQLACEKLFRFSQPFRAAGIQHGNRYTMTQGRYVKQIVPIFLALIPFAAVVGAVVTVP